MQGFYQKKDRRQKIQNPITSNKGSIIQKAQLASIEKFYKQ